MRNIKKRFKLVSLLGLLVLTILNLLIGQTSNLRPVSAQDGQPIEYACVDNSLVFHSIQTSHTNILPGDNQVFIFGDEGGVVPDVSFSVNIELDTTEIPEFTADKIRVARQYLLGGGILDGNWLSGSGFTFIDSATARISVQSRSSGNARDYSITGTIPGNQFNYLPSRYYMLLQYNKDGTWVDIQYKDRSGLDTRCAVNELKIELRSDALNGGSDVVFSNRCESIGRPEGFFTCNRYTVTIPGSGSFTRWVAIDPFSLTLAEDSFTALMSDLSRFASRTDLTTVDQARAAFDDIFRTYGVTIEQFTPGGCSRGTRVWPQCGITANFEIRSGSLVEVNPLDGTTIDRDGFANVMDANFPNTTSVCLPCIADTGRCGGDSTMNLTVLGRSADDQTYAEVEVSGCIDNYSVDAMPMEYTLESATGTFDHISATTINPDTGLYSQRYRLYVGQATRIIMRPSDPLLTDLVQIRSIPPLGTTITGGLGPEDSEGGDGNFQGLEACALVGTASEATSCRNCLRARGTWTALGCIVTTPEGLFASIVRLALGVMGGVALLRMIYLGYIYQVGSDKQIAAARQGVLSTLGGLVILVFSVVLLRIIGVNILDIVPAGFYGV